MVQKNLAYISQKTLKKDEVSVKKTMYLSLFAVRIDKGIYMQTMINILDQQNSCICSGDSRADAGQIFGSGHRRNGIQKRHNGEGFPC